MASADAKRDSARIRLRTAQTVVLVTVLGFAVCAVGIPAYFNARYTAEDLGAKVIEQSAGRIEQHVIEGLDIAESESLAASLLFADGALDPDDHVRVTEYFLAAMRANPSLSYLSVGLETGKYYHVHRDSRGALELLELLPEGPDARRLLEWRVGEDGGRIEVRNVFPSSRTPPYERPYYRWAREAEGPIWTETYVFLGSGEELDIPGVTRTIPMRGDDGAFIGVLTADFDMLALSRYLRSLPVGDAGFAFLVELRGDGSRRVVAHPRAVDPNPAARLELTRAAPGGEGREALDAAEVDDPVVAAILGRIPAGVDALEGGDGTLRFDAGGVSYLGELFALGGEDSPRWILCVVVPDDEILGGIRDAARITLGSAFFGVLLTVLLAIFLSSRMSSQLRAIADETKAIADFHLDPKPLPGSRIEEIDRLETAMEEMKAGLRSFRKFVPADLVRTIVTSGEEARLGGERREITLYFSDIAGFTRIAEELSPEKLVEVLATYLELMTGEMLRAGGTVDKYVGDAIMAFWGAPLANPEHPRVACATALANQRALAELRARFVRAGLPPLRARIGLHTGEAIVGNFGSESRLDYTAIGDAVNLASRLEGINKVYGTEIILSEATQARVQGEFVTRLLDRVAVKGRREGVLIYELVGEVGTVPEARRALLDLYTRGFESYQAGAFREAVGAFEAVLEADPEDGPAKVMLERARRYLGEPPPPDWGGIFRAKHK